MLSHFYIFYNVFDFAGTSCSIFYIFIVKHHNLFRFISFKFNICCRRYNFHILYCKKVTFSYTMFIFVLRFLFVYPCYWQLLAHSEPYLNLIFLSFRVSNKFSVSLFFQKSYLVTCVIFVCFKLYHQH